jgi:hypothetical protein
MARALQPPHTRAGVAFELEHLEPEDGRLLVHGRWSGVRGMRFVRPTLLIGERAVLATLEHKPWAPEEDEIWTAAFPWPGGSVDVDELALTVAPSVTVALSPEAPDTRSPQPRASTPPAQPRPIPSPRPVDPVAEDLRAQVLALTDERDALRRCLEDVEAEAAQRTVRARHLEDTAHDVTAERDELHFAWRAAERERDHAVAQRDEATAAHRATRARLEEALAGRDEALARCRSADTELTALATQRDEVRLQRDDAVLAHRALRRRATAGGPDGALAAGVSPTSPPAPSPAPDPRRESPPRARHSTGDEPLGVLAIPAGRTIAADLHRSEHPRGRVISGADLWALRVFGSIAAIVFILLLAGLLRVFL